MARSMKLAFTKGRFDLRFILFYPQRNLTFALYRPMVEIRYIEFYYKCKVRNISKDHSSSFTGLLFISLNFFSIVFHQSRIFGSRFTHNSGTKDFLTIYFPYGTALVWKFKKRQKLMHLFWPIIRFHFGNWVCKAWQSCYGVIYDDQNTSIWEWIVFLTASGIKWFFWELCNVCYNNPEVLC